MKIDSFNGKYRFLSNFSDSELKEIAEDGTVIVYPTVEHAFQAAKSMDIQTRVRVSKEATPGDAKHAGKRNGYVILRADWEEVKDGIMLGLLRQKFSDPTLKEKLLATGDAELIEGNNWGDDYWGVCTQRGQNKLGKLLMQVRNEINQSKEHLEEKY